MAFTPRWSWQKIDAGVDELRESWEKNELNNEGKSFDVDDGGGKISFVDVRPITERVLLNELFVDERNCCRWVLKPKIFGWINAHFSHNDVSQSRQ